MDQPTAEDIQVSIDEAREMVAMGAALERLFQNRDFEAIILQGFFKDEPARLVELKAAPQMQDPERQAGLLKAMDAIGGLQQHFNMLRVAAEQARMAIEYSEQELAEMAAEGEV